MDGEVSCLHGTKVEKTGGTPEHDQGSESLCGRAGGNVERTWPKGRNTFFECPC